MTTNVMVLHNQAASRFEATVEGLPCVADYSLRGDIVTFTHTEVPASLQGRGIAAALVRTALDWCAEQELRVVPACSYVRGYMQRHQDTQRLLAS